MKKTIGTLVSVIVLVASVSGIALAQGGRRPANDDLAAAVAIAELPFSATVNTKGASLEPDEVQPSCRRIRSSVWYSVTGAGAGLQIAQLSSTFPAALAVYEQTPEALVETACMADRASIEMELKVESSKTYMVQLGSTARKQGKADLSLTPSPWKEISLFDQTFSREGEEQHVPILKVKGAPRETNPSMYDVTVQISEQVPVTVGVFTFGLVTQEIEQELVRIPASATEVTMKVTGRYDSSQYSCAADDGADTCYAGIPLKDLGWLTGGDGSRAELVVSIRAERNGEVLIERTQTVPYAGQILGLLP